MARPRSDGQGAAPDSELVVGGAGLDEVVEVPWPQLWRARFGQRAQASPRFAWIVLATVLFGLFTVSFTITILTVSIPRIAHDLGASQSSLTWVVTGPILAFGVIGPAVGKLGDLWGQRRIYLLGLAGAALFAGCSALAWSAPSLIAFRVLGAVEGAATGPGSFALISLVFPREQRVKALGFYSMVAAGGPVLGVVAGGPLVSAVGWRVIFLAQVPLTLVALLVAFLVLPETKRLANQSFDWAGAALLAVAVTPLLFALNQGPSLGWSHPLVLAGFALPPLMLAAFAHVEKRVAQPLIPLRYFRRRNFAFPIVTQGFLNAAYMGSFVLTPLLLENVLGYDETKTGLVSIARPLSFSIVGPVAGYLAVRVGERVAGVVGAAAVLASMLWMSTIGATSTPMIIAGGLALAGIGLGASSPSLASSITNAVDEADLGVAGAAQQMMTQVGITIGIQAMQTVQQVRRGPAGLAGSYHQAYLAGAVLAALGLGTATFIRRIARTSSATFGAGRTDDIRLEPA